MPNPLSRRWIARIPMNHHLASCLVALLLCGPALAQTTWYVDDDNCPGPGAGTLVDPFCSIQDAIVQAVNGDEIIVALGTYFETINFLGKAVTVRSTDPNDAGVVMNTIIDGGSLGSVVTCNNEEGASTVLSGFVITNGNTIFDGGGMYNNNSSPTVTNCSFIGNKASSVGGGMANFSSSPTVTNCSFSGNTATSVGGGMANFSSNPTVTNCSFIGNTATSTTAVGGGMFNFGSSPIVTSCLFDGNLASSTGGGGMFNTSASIPTIANTGFCNNKPDQLNGTHNDNGGNSTEYCPPPTPMPTSCRADISGDTNVNVTDLLQLLAAWGACP